MPFLVDWRRLGRLRRGRLRLEQRRSDRRFAREFAALARETDIAWDELRGPGPAPSWKPAVRAVDELPVEPLTCSDRTHYVRSWSRIRNEFSGSPLNALTLAEQLAGSLLITRGLVPSSARRPTRLPGAWVFPSADGYRRAQWIVELSTREEGASALSFTEAGLREALRLFEAFYLEILTTGRWLSTDQR